jgi:hypothetical protein
MIIYRSAQVLQEAVVYGDGDLLAYAAKPDAAKPA